MARAALRRHLHNDTPAMLTRDHDAALGLLLAQAIAEACLALIPYAGDCTTDADGEITAVELRGTPARAAEIRIALEAAVAACVLQSAFEGADDGYAARLRDICSQGCDETGAGFPHHSVSLTRSIASTHIRPL